MSSKYLASVPKREQSDRVEAPRSSGKCDSCGWQFDREYREKMQTDHTKFRLLTRDQVAIAIRRDGAIVAVVTRCGDCYERELYARGKHRYSGMECVEGMHKQSIAAGARFMEQQHEHF